jgi:fucose 4-O-acetylase-like acetyltransferase
MTEGRDIQLDALRGLAIILVVMGHVLAFSDVQHYQNKPLFNIIYYFHMPLFFFISGFLVNGHFQSPTVFWVKKKFMGLVVPYLLFSFMYFFIFRGFSLSSLTLDNLLRAVFSYVNSNSAWFLPVLFETLVVLAIVINAEKKLKVFTLPTVLIVFLVILPLIPISSVKGIDQIVRYSPFVIIGYYISIYNQKNSLIPKMDLDITKKDLVFALLYPIIYLLRNIPFFYTWNSKIAEYLSGHNILIILNNYSAQLFFLYYFYITAFAGIAMCFVIVKILSKLQVMNFFILCGILSMEIYLTHLVVLFYSSLFQVPLWFGQEYITVLSGTLIVLALALCLSFILLYNKIISRIFFGRWAFNYVSGNKFTSLLCIISLVGYLYLINILLPM